MPGPLEHPVLGRPDIRRMMGGTAVDAIGVAVDRDGGHRDWRPRDETGLDVGDGRIAGNEAEAVSIGVDDDVDEFGVVECGGRAFERRVVERPARGHNFQNGLVISRRSVQARRARARSGNSTATTSLLLAPAGLSDRSMF
jgi:hypothetical protein